MTTEHLWAIGTLLYGERWQSSLSQAVGVNVRTVQRWAAGKNDCPAWLVGKLATLLKARKTELEKAIISLSV